MTVESAQLLVVRALCDSPLRNAECGCKLPLVDSQTPFMPRRTMWARYAKLLADTLFTMRASLELTSDRGLGELNSHFVTRWAGLLHRPQRSMFFIDTSHTLCHTSMSGLYMRDEGIKLSISCTLAQQCLEVFVKSRIRLAIGQAKA